MPCWGSAGGGGGEGFREAMGAPGHAPSLPGALEKQRGQRVEECQGITG